jgi:plastocyanin
VRMLRRQLFPITVLGVASVFAFTGLSAATGPTIEAVGLSWSPSSASINTTETVTFKNFTGTHGLNWKAGPSTPSCAGSIPTGPAGGASWEGSCTFTQAGSYSFVCSVHSVMTGTVTVTSSGPGAPIVGASATGTPSGDTEATLSGSVNPNGLATEYWFEYGADAPAYGEITAKTQNLTGDASVPASKNLTGLSAGTTYHFRLVAKNSAGETTGGDHTFTTFGPPTATTNSATSVGSATATLRGSLNPGGHETSYFFEYGTDVSYGEGTSVLEKTGVATVAVSAPVTGLLPVTTYHFRLVAENGSSAGPVKGVDRTFTTTAIPPPTEETPPAGAPPPTTTTPPSTASPSPPRGPALGFAVKVAPGKNGAPVRGSVEVLAPGAGGKLVVELRTKGRKGALVGKATKAGVAAGRVSFSVPLNSKAKSILKSRGRLALAVAIVLTPPSGAPVSVTKSVTVTA